jgi:hypothetical protein
MTRWYAAWADGTQLTDSVVVDVSALAPAVTAVKVRSIDLALNGDLQVDLEFDATTDELLDRFIGQTDVTYQILRDYTDGPNAAYVPDQSATGFAGDVLLTTTGAASGDEVNLLIVFEKAT